MVISTQPFMVLYSGGGISPSNGIYKFRIFRQLKTLHVSEELIEWQIESDKETREFNLYYLIIPRNWDVLVRLK